MSYHELWLSRQVCEICETPGQCFSNKYPCDLCGEFIGEPKIYAECLNSWLYAAVRYFGSYRAFCEV